MFLSIIVFAFVFLQSERLAAQATSLKGHWVYGPQKTYPKGIIQCEGTNTNKCAYIVDAAFDGGGSDLLPLPINFAKEGEKENIVTYKIKKLYREKNEKGEAVYRTEPPVEWPK